jgi:hypothetical protein
LQLPPAWPCCLSIFNEIDQATKSEIFESSRK